MMEASIEVLRYQFQINEVGFMVEETVGLLKTHFNRENILDKWEIIQNEIIEDHSIWKSDASISKNEFKAKKDAVLKLMRKNGAKRLDKFELIMVNQALVMMCSILEQFILHLIRIISTKNTSVLTELSKEKDKPIKDIIKIGNSKDIISAIRNKALIDLGFVGIEKKLMALDKTGVNISLAFGFGGFKEETKKRCREIGYEGLIKIFEKRHDIVHYDKLPIINKEELLEISDFFQRTIQTLTAVTSKKYKIPIKFPD